MKIPSPTSKMYKVFPPIINQRLIIEERNEGLVLLSKEKGLKRKRHLLHMHFLMLLTYYLLLRPFSCSSLSGVLWVTKSYEVHFDLFLPEKDVKPMRCSSEMF